MNFSFDFLKLTRPGFTLSLVLFLVSAVVVGVPFIPGLGGNLPFGLNPGLDFTGGTQLRVQFADSTSTEAVRGALNELSRGEEALGTSEIHEFADLPRTKAIKFKSTDEDRIDAIVSGLEDAFPGLTVISREVIGAQISQELVTSGWQSTVLVLVVMLLYLSWRFQFKYAVGAVVALMHDVLIALGVFALFSIEINLPVIAAFLTIVGYSVNDTIVIFDRIRENLASHRRGDPYELINLSLNQSLRRTVHTSLTTFLPVFVLTLFGGEVLFAFALALLMGVVVGTYSSIFVASTLVHQWGKRASA